MNDTLITVTYSDANWAIACALGVLVVFLVVRGLLNLRPDPRTFLVTVDHCGLHPYLRTDEGERVRSFKDRSEVLKVTARGMDAAARVALEIRPGFGSWSRRVRNVENFRDEVDD